MVFGTGLKYNCPRFHYSDLKASLYPFKIATMKIILVLMLIISAPLTSFLQNSPNADFHISRKTFTYKTVGKTPIKADLFHTKSNNELKPAIVWIHGGGLIFGSRTDLPEEQKMYYLKAGYSIVSIDYRLAPETKLPEIVNDVKDAIQWIHQNGKDSLGIDATKLFVIGHSGGAYLALLSGHFPNNPLRGIVSFYGYGDIQGDWCNKPDSFYLTQTIISDAEAKKLIIDSIITSASYDNRFNLYKYSRQNGFWTQLVSGHNIAKERNWFASYCPAKNIPANYPPVLLIHGNKDTDVPFSQSLRMAKQLKKNKIQYRFVEMNNYNHVFDLLEGGLSNPDIAKVFEEVRVFLNDNK